MDYPPVSRRDFCRSAILASSLVAAGIPSEVLAMGDRAPTNVQVSDDGHEDHYEPCLAVNPRDPRNLLAVCQLMSGGPATYSSFDGGRAWRSNGQLSLPAGVVAGGNTALIYTRSTDGGKTFETPRTIARDPGGLNDAMPCIVQPRSRTTTTPTIPSMDANP